MNVALLLTYWPIREHWSLNRTYLMAFSRNDVAFPRLDPSDLQNFIPISNLPYLSKILENVLSASCILTCMKVMHTCMKNFSQALGHTLAQKLHSLKSPGPHLTLSTTRS